MKFWEAMKAVEEGKKVRVVTWTKDLYVCLDKDRHVVNQNNQKCDLLYEIGDEEWELSEQGDYSLYPEGSLWQDGSSRDKENMLNWYVRKNGEWVFGFRALAIDFFSPIYPKEKSNETQN